MKKGYKNLKEKKGLSSIEYIIIVAFALTLTAMVVTTLNKGASSATNKSNNLIQSTIGESLPTQKP